MLLTRVGVAFLPASRCAGGELGITLKIRKTRTETTKRTITIPIRRRTMKRSISGPSLDRGPLGLDHPGVRLEPHFRARVECVAEAVADDVQREHRQHDHHAGD